MKKVKDTIYGFCVVTLLITCVIYFAVVIYNGLSSIGDYSMNGVSLFLNQLFVGGLLIVGPVKRYITKTVARIKNERKKQNKNKNQTIDIKVA